MVDDNAVIHILRNPWNWSADEVRKARLTAAERFERTRNALQILVALIVDADHERGCAGRNYACSCGYDASVYDAAIAARAELTAAARPDEAC